MPDDERAAARRRGRGRPPGSVLRQPPGRGPGPADAAAHPRRRAARLRRQGYHGCSIDRITKLARCSRVSFYQYFASKEDVFRQLAGQVARQVSAVDRGARPAHRRRRRLGRAAGVGRAATPRSTRATSRSSTRSRPTTTSRPWRGAHGRRDHRADPRPVGDDDAAAPPARPRHPAAARVPEPHARRRRHPPLGRARRLPGASASSSAITDVHAPHAVRLRTPT